MRSLILVLSVNVLSSSAQENVEVGKRIKVMSYPAFQVPKGGGVTVGLLKEAAEQRG